MKTKGATAEGTKHYAEHMSAVAAPGHFRVQQGLAMSSIGLGTYLGHWDDATDKAFRFENAGDGCRRFYRRAFC